jgi:pyridoxal phosphate enzyme (YggS family)
MSSKICDNINRIKSEIDNKVHLVAVSKTKPIEDILEAYQCGQRDFGENKVQEMRDKQNQLPPDIRWHLIGHLQRNKVKYIAPYVHLIHSVDNIKLLKEINKQAIKNNRTIPVLLQIKIAKEDTKYGMSFEEAKNLMDSPQIKELKNISIEGLMGMATNTPDIEQRKKEFHSLKNFFDEMKITFPSFKYLSMGMSGDYPIAIEEGSNMIRVGSNIFGKRDYSQK